MPVTNTRPAVLVSAAALNPKAVAMLETAGYAVINTSGYPGEPELIAALQASTSRPRSPAG